MKVVYRSQRPLEDILPGGSLGLTGFLTSALFSFRFKESSTQGGSYKFPMLLNGSTLHDLTVEDVITNLNNALVMWNGSTGQPTPIHPEFQFSLSPSGQIQLTAPDTGIVIHAPYDRTVNSYDLLGETPNLVTLLGVDTTDDVVGFDETLTEDYGSYDANESPLIMAFDNSPEAGEQKCFFIHDGITGRLIHSVEWSPENNFDLSTLAASLNIALKDLGYDLVAEAVLGYAAEDDPNTFYNVLVFTSTSAENVVYRFTCSPTTWFLGDYSGSDFIDITGKLIITTTNIAGGGTPPVVEGPAVKFINTVGGDRRVKLVPKTPEAKIANLKGGELEMVELEQGALGFCLAGNPCYGSTPAVALDLNTTDTFNAIIAGEERSNLTYEQLKAFLTSNGLSVVDTSPVIKCVPTDLSLTMPREITMGANDTVYLTVMMEGEITTNQTIQDKDGQDVQLPPGMAQIAVQNSEFSSNPNYLLRQLFFYSGFDLARQLNADRAFHFNYDDGVYNNGYNDDYEDSGQSAVMSIVGMNPDNMLNPEGTIIVRNPSTLKFIPTPPQYIFDDNYIDFVSAVMLNDGEESIEVHSCAVVYSTAS